LGASCRWTFGDDNRAVSTLIGDNVQFAARLKGMNEAYGTNILISSDFIECLSADRRVLCRRIDRIFVPEREKPVDLYTIDIDPMPVVFIQMFQDSVAAYLAGE